MSAPSRDKARAPSRDDKGRDDKDRDTSREAAFGLEILPGSSSLGVLEFVYRQLLDAVLSQRLKPGARLQEQALAEIFRTGRTTVRAALQRLAHDGVVDLQANRGARVDRPGPDEVHDLFDARRVIECELIARSAALARRGELTAADLEPLAALAREEAGHIAAGRRGAALRLACEFHLGLAGLAGNASLVAALERQVVRIALAVGLFERGGHESASSASRGDLLDVVLAGDVRGARREMRAHLDGLERSLDLDVAQARDELDAAFAHLDPGRGA